MGCGAVETGRAMGGGGVTLPESGTAWPFDNHPRSEATTNPMIIPAVKRAAVTTQLFFPCGGLGPDSN
jgi:hypothetical protein